VNRLSQRLFNDSKIFPIINGVLYDNHPTSQNAKLPIMKNIKRYTAFNPKNVHKKTSNKLFNSKQDNLDGDWLIEMQLINIGTRGMLS
jgi:hypothetical protein